MKWGKKCPECGEWTTSIRVIIWACKWCNTKLDEQKIRLLDDEGQVIEI